MVRGKDVLRLHLPAGSAWDLGPGTLHDAELAAVGAIVERFWSQRDALTSEAFPATTAELVASWERVLDLHPPTSRTIGRRRAAVIARLLRLPNFRPSTIEAIAEQLLGLQVELVEPMAFRCDSADSVCDSADDVVDGAFVFCVDVNAEAARLAEVHRAELDQVLDEIKPAHTVGLSRFYGAFRTDSAFSTTNRDPLGA